MIRAADARQLADKCALEYVDAKIQGAIHDGAYSVEVTIYNKAVLFELAKNFYKVIEIADNEYVISWS